MTTKAIQVFVAVVVAAIVPAGVAQPHVTFTRTFNDVRLRFLSTQITTDPKARAEWGFSALVEADDARLLFDTGNQPDTVTANAKLLDVRLEGVHDIVLSHWHIDHTGGVRSVLDVVGENSTKVFVHPAIFDEKFASKSTTTQVNPLRDDRATIEAKHGVFDMSAEPREIRPGFVLTGGIPRPHERDQKLPNGNLMRQGGTLVADTIPDEQSLVINTRDGLVVVTGCGHAGVVNTIEYVRRLFPDRPIAALVGGFHWFASSEAEVVDAGEQLHTLGVSRLVGAHCTLVEPMFTLRQHGWSRTAAAVGAIGSDFVLHRSAASPGHDVVTMPATVAAARPAGQGSSCHAGS